MNHITGVRDALTVCDAMGSEVRVEILETILQHKAVNLDTLAKTLHLTNGALTAHIKKLSDAGLIRVTLGAGKRGKTKICTIAEDKILIDIDPAPKEESGTLFRMPVGSFTAARVMPHCGMADQDGLLGETDDERYFTHPHRSRAAAVWFNGMLSYTLPVPARAKGKPKRITVTFEAGALNKETALRIFLDDKEVGEAPVKQFSDRRGVLTPAWFPEALPQYGSLKTLTIDMGRVKLDGIDLEPVAHTPATLTFASTGAILFSSRFGDYNTDILCAYEY